MKYTLKVENGKALISFKVSAADWETEMENAYQKNKQKYSQPGFRKGHVPRKVLEGLYGNSLFLEDAFNDAFPRYYSQVLTEHEEIYPVEMPSVDFESYNADGFKFKAEVTLKPEFTLGQYKGLQIAKSVVTVSNDEIDAELNRVQEQNCRLVDVERAVENGDEVTMDYSGAVDGVKFDGGTAENQTLVIGSGKFVPGFEEQLIGATIGETRDIDVTFPEQYHAEHLAGKKAIFTVTIHQIKVKQLQPIDDDFAKDYSEFDTLAQYKEDIQKNLTAQKQKEAEKDDDNKLLDALTEHTPIEIPEAMIESQVDSYVEEFEYTLRSQGLKMDDYMKYTNSTKESLREMYKPRAKKSVHVRMILEAIEKAEKIKATAKEVDAKIKEYSKDSGKTAQEFKAGLKQEHLDYIKSQVTQEKIMDLLRKENILA